MRATRLVTAGIVLASLALWMPTTSQAAPSHQDLANAKAELASLMRQQGSLIEQYDAATVKLQQVTAALNQARTEMQQEQAAARQAQQEVAQSAATAYETSGSELSVILGSTSLSQLTDRVQFLQTLAQHDADAATRAKVAEQRARVASQRLSAALKQRKQILADLSRKKAQIQASIARQQSLVKKIEREIHHAYVLSQAAQGTGGGLQPPGGLPPPPSAGAQAAVNAAESQLGVPYVWGGDTPGVGFDCSGLTMWSWGQAGVSMPHFAAAQYAMFPHVTRSELEPGDLVFFYQDISHVGMYIGNGMMIDAPYTGTVVRIDPIYWNVFVGGARP